MLKIKTAVLPVAGLGSRVMPLTVHQPKAMIGIVDRPMIHYIIDEIVAGGIKQIVIVTGPNQKEFKGYIRHLQSEPEWKKLRIKFNFVIQKHPNGNGDAIYIAKKLLRNHPFLVYFPDDLLEISTQPTKTLIKMFNKVGKPIVALEPVPKIDVPKYGVVKPSRTKLSKDLYLIEDVVEKPKLSEAPSNLTIIGRYVLNSDILNELSKLYPIKNKEIGLADALKNYVLQGGKLYGWHFRGARFDAGSKIGILKAQAYFGIKHKEMGREFKRYLSKQLKTN